MGRIVTRAAAGAVAALALAGCGSTSPPPSSTGGGSYSQGNGTPSTAPASTGSADSGSAGSGSAAPGSGASGSSQASGTCSSLHLALQVAGSSPAAGTQLTRVILRNAGTAPCTMQGFPGASFLDQEGQPVGSPARRHGDSGATVILAPGQVANAQLRSARSTCRTDSPESASVRIFPPGNTGALTTFLQVPICGASTITSVAAGVGQGTTGPAVPAPHTDDPATCSSTHLALTLGPSQGAAGSQINDLALRNAGTSRCRLSGFPGVSLLDSQFRQLAAPATRNGPAGSPITLAPGSTAHAQLRTSLVRCAGQGPTSTYVRVFPPGERGPLQNLLVAPGCATPEVTALSPGSGSS
jgi:hypothetical protein